MTASWTAFIGIGFAAGILSGLFGIGGGLIIVPALALAFGFEQQAATATSLIALLFPVGALAVWTYWQAGKISGQHVTAGLLIAAGMLVGGLFGSKIGVSLDPLVARRAFAIFMVMVASRMWFS